MKKRLFAYSVIICCIMVAVAGCKDNKSKAVENDEDELELAAEEPLEGPSKLQMIVEEGSKGCPMSLGDVGEITSVTFEDNTVTYYYELNEQYTDVAALAADRQKMKQNMMTMLTSPNANMQAMFKLVIEEDAKMRFVMHGKTSDATARITFDADELQEILDSDITPEERMQTAIEQTNLQMPMNVADGMTITELRLIGNKVTYICIVDENKYNINLMKQNRAQMKQAILNAVSNMGPVEKNFIQYIVDAGRDLAYRYQGNTSAEYIDVVVTNSELSGY